MAIIKVDFLQPVLHRGEISEADITEAIRTAIADGKYTRITEMAECTPEGAAGRVVVYPDADGDGAVVIESKRRGVLPKTVDAVTHTSNAGYKTTNHSIPREGTRFLLDETIPNIAATVIGPFAGRSIVAGSVRRVVGAIVYQPGSRQ